jgi:tyramine---L-glutamate ligase
MVSFGFGDRKALRILLYEHVSSGGFAGEPMPPSLLSEGYAMLSGLTADFRAAGQEVTVLLDSRIAEFNPPLVADHIVQIESSGEADQTMDQATETADAAYVVAPEPNHVLQSIVECIETTGTLSLNCRATAIEQASDKAVLGERVRRLGLHFPQTKTFNATDSAKKISQTIRRELGFPAVIKPANGAGCSGLSIAQNEKQTAQAIGKVKLETASTTITAQEFIEGIPASVSLITNGAEALPVSLNLQNIAIAAPDENSTYNGGLVPFEHSLRGEAFRDAKLLAESFRGLRGYVGIDFVLAKDKAFVMEINPRLTTSYIGLRKTANFNVPQAIINSVLKGELPNNPQCHGYTCFSKVLVAKTALLNWRGTYPISEVVSPPFPVAQEGTAFALVQSMGNTADEASTRTGEAKKHLNQVLQRGNR